MVGSTHRSIGLYLTWALLTSHVGPQLILACLDKIYEQNLHWGDMWDEIQQEEHQLLHELHDMLEGAIGTKASWKTTKRDNKIKQVRQVGCADAAT